MIDKIKYFIYRIGGQRGKELLTVLKGILFEIRYVRRATLMPSPNANVFHFVFDPHYSHPGLADRLKAILGCYYIAKQNGYSFKIVWREPFPLSDFLSESRVRWQCDGHGPAYSIRNTRFFIYSGLRKGLGCKLRPNKEYVCCCYKGDDLFYVNGVSDFDKRFGSLFNELFQPSDMMRRLLAGTGLTAKGYVSVHARFVNALGQFESSKYPILPVERQKDLLSRCRAAVGRVAEDTDLPVVIFSDSKRFLREVEDLPVIVLDSDSICHLSKTSDFSAFAKTFLDFFVISQSKKLYRLCAPELYATNFSLYASFAGNTEEEDIQV